VAALPRLPKHLSVVLSLPPDQKDVSLLLNRLDGLMHDACEIAAWSTAAGIPVLSIYERSGTKRNETSHTQKRTTTEQNTNPPTAGLLKSSLTHLHRRIETSLTAYYGSSPLKPTFSLRAPNIPSYEPPVTPPNNPSSPNQSPQRPHLSILLLDQTDGRQTLVDLTKTLTDMSQSHKLRPSDISQELIDAEISESVMSEPDLLLLFGEKAVLEGYPPWQVRLTEIFALQDWTGGVGYHVFLRGLRRYGGAEMRFGR